MSISFNENDTDAKCLCAIEVLNEAIQKLASPNYARPPHESCLRDDATFISSKIRFLIDAREFFNSYEMAANENRDHFWKAIAAAKKETEE